MSQGVKTSDAVRNAICARYLVLHSENKVAEEFGVHQGTVHNILKRAGIQRRRYRRLSADEESQILAAWQEGEPVDDIVAKFDVTSDYVYTLTRSVLGPALAFRSLRTYELNEAAFDERSEARDYWVGFLMADGSVAEATPSRAPALSLKLAMQDAGHVEKFRAFLGATHPITRVANKRGFSRNSQDLAAFSVVSRRIVAKVGEFGVVPRKTYCACVRHLEDSKDFWRGAVDGDGEIVLQQQASSHMARLGLVGHKALIEQFAAFVNKSIGRLPAIQPAQAIWYVRLCGKPAEAMIHVLHDGATVSLDRKAAVVCDIQTRRRRLDAEAAERLARDVPEQYRCTVLGCGKRKNALGLCPMHYRRHRLANATAICHEPDCGLAVYAKGLCANHYNRARLAAKRLTPA